jgi:predicted nucleic acid-binding protein
MKYVLDASVGIKWVMNEIDSPQARHIRDDFRNQIHELIAPDSFPLEAAHALTKAGRRGIVTDATRLWVELMVDSPQFFPSMPLMLRALAIAGQARIGVYDCLYVALAEREGCELVTGDARLVNSSSLPIPSSSRWRRCHEPRCWFNAPSAYSLLLLPRVAIRILRTV